MNRIFYIIALLGVCFSYVESEAQAPSRRRLKAEEESAGSTLSVRAQSQYTPVQEIPKDLMWKREIYRTVDLTKEANTALYYPDKPMGDRMNLFSLIFKLAVEKKIKVYEYNMDGNEQFQPAYVTKPKDMLDRFGIYYREKLVNRRDTVIEVDNSDIPSNEVKSYFVKEVYYFDGNSSVFDSQIEALCPVLHRTDEFTSEETKYPMFWVKFEDLEQYLSSSYVMTSDYNNVSNVTLSDYFVAGMYSGDIYKTTNRLNRTLSQYCPTDSLMKAEQAKIEKQLVDFEQSLWSVGGGTEAPKDSTMAVAEENKEVESPENSKRVGRDEQGVETVSVKSKTASSKKSAKPKGKSGGSSVKKGSSAKAAPRASVRRERR